jgi:hypothetical protein
VAFPPPGGTVGKMIVAAGETPVKAMLPAV